jgi:hypothetical protein
MDVKKLYWLAGLLEGEGSFGFYNGGPMIQLKMNDLDVIQKAHKVLGCTSNVVTVSRPAPEHNVGYKAIVQGSRAIGWMFTVYPLMGKRRQEQISKAITEWKNHSAVSNPHRHKGKITVVDGEKVCTLHGAVKGLNERRIGRWVYCKGCYRPARVANA